MGSKRRRRSDGRRSSRGRQSQVSYAESEFDDEGKSYSGESSNTGNEFNDNSDYSENEDPENSNYPSFQVKLKLPKRPKIENTNASQEDEIKDEIADDEEEEDDDEEDEVINVRRTTRRSQSLVKSKDEDDDEYVAEEEDDDDDDLPSNGSDGESEYERQNRRAEDRNFIAIDDSEAERRKRRRHRLAKKNKSRSSSRRLRRKPIEEEEDDSYDEDGDDEDEEIDNDSIKDELEELKSTPEPSPPPKKQLRERNKNINYQIPPPLDTSNIDDSLGVNAFDPAPVPVRRIPKSAGLNKALFSVAGPFGGNDIIPIFGGGNMPMDLGINGNANNGINNNLDSSSSDDDFVTRPYDARMGSIVPNNTNTASNNNNTNNNLGMINTKKQKKNANADSDPLGVDTNIDFSSVGGLDNYISQLKEMVALPLLYPEVYTKFGITPPRGVLFHGPPGTGKTLMARALAASCSTKDQKITFFMRKGADCLSKWVGEAERQLRLLFEEAKKQQPSIIFFDEIDGLAPVRSSKQEQIHASIVSTLLALMDGMDGRGQVIVIGATNRPDAIDPALRRPGRFDREFYFSLPDAQARLTILNIHTKKWNPKPNPKLISKLADLTKGYGGSDIRALCTEAALNSIKRKFPQIYDSEKKLVINPEEIKVHEVDFLNALEKIVPSSSRSTTNASNPLPDHLKPLLTENYNKITKKINSLISKKGSNKKGNSTLVINDESDEDDDQLIEDKRLEEEFGISKHDLLKKLNSSRIFKPRLLITGSIGMGQKYLGSSILNYLEGFQIQSMDLGTLYGESGRSPEAAIIQMFLEAKRNQPSIVYIPNFEIWVNSVPESAKSTLEGLLRSLNSSEKILLLGVSEIDSNNIENELELNSEISRFFGIGNNNIFKIFKPSKSNIEEYFKFLWIFLKTKPIFQELNNDDPNYLKFKEIKNFKKIKSMKVVNDNINENDENDETKKLKEIREKEKQLKQQYKIDVRLKNLLKIKLSTIMEVFKSKYKRFKKPVIPLQQLAHLFEPSLLEPTTAENGETSLPPLVPSPQYLKDDNMIIDTYTGKKYFNMELDTIEERLWNGYYSEPKQFLKDIEMIYIDSRVSEDRERMLKASEMFVNAQVSIEEMFSHELIEQCKNLRKREVEKQKEYEKKVADLKLKMESNKENLINNGPPLSGETVNKPINVGIIVNGDSELIGNDLIDGNVINDLTDHAANGENVISENGVDKPIKEPLQHDESTKMDIDIEEPPKITEKSIGELLLEKFSKEELEAFNKYEQKVQSNKSKSIILDENYLNMVQSNILERSQGLNIEELEMINSILSEVIWNEKFNWNRNEVLKKVEKKFKSALKIIDNENNLITSAGSH